MLLAKANDLLAKNKLKEAEFHYKTILNSNPQSGEALFGLGRIALRMEQFDAAVYLLQRACERMPKMLESLHALADAFNGVNSPTDALKVMQYTKSIAPHNPEIHYYLAQHYLTYGELDKAHSSLVEALKLGTFAVTPYILFELVQLGRFDEKTNYIKNLHQLLTKTNNVRLKVVCYYALAKSYDQLEDIDQAFNYYQLANKLQLTLSQFSTQQLDPFYQRIIAHHDTEFFKQIQTTTEVAITPVFIIGMPRSGSTLIEQILLSHSDFTSLGEDNSISNKVVPFIEQQTGLAYPQCVKALTPSLIQKARKIYLNHIEQSVNTHPFVLNKLPANYQSLGLIYRLFPNAKFIYAEREFKAITWSVFSNFFYENEPYFCSINEFTHYYLLAKSLMTHWHQHVGEAIYTLNYENLTTNPTKELQQLLMFLGCDYRPAMLDFYKSKKPVTTLSKASVRKPIYTHALTKWQRFEKLLMAHGHT